MHFSKPSKWMQIANFRIKPNEKIALNFKQKNNFRLKFKQNNTKKNKMAQKSKSMSFHFSNSQRWILLIDILFKWAEPSFVFSVRFFCMIMILLGYCLNYMQKIDMGIAIVCMTNHTALRLMENQPKTNKTLYLINSNDTSNDCPVPMEKEKSDVT